MSEQTDSGEDRRETGNSSASTKLFDIRTIIGGLFVVYGVLVGFAGIFPTKEGLAKAQGININLWTGLSMLLLGGLFLLWVKLRPLEAPEAPAEEASESAGPIA
ncbi:hypothetical protein [Actinopolyspora saharensis]|uniref:Uncharacterized protein n=1 Tax=Actinopolyspora saharensis TaxID=995062 RepID=A0A1H1DZ48_9ACTN|nr:hypothetical protein [Actinopolyspora saharensis]SDQ81727.1 hypothetical protein SAMN04489718_2302 [Actinopolyspora saharensis]